MIGVWGSAAHGARPMETDDAAIVDPKGCQLETWLQAYRGRSEWWAFPACNPTGNLELTVGGALTREDGHTRGADGQLQGKSILRPLEPNGLGIGVSAGTVRDSAAGARDWYTDLQASLSRADDALVVHANAGWLRAGEARRHRVTGGIGMEAELVTGTWLIAESFTEGAGRPLHQIGLRRWVIPERIQIDATYGNRNGGGMRWFTLGLRLLSPPFLP